MKWNEGAYYAGLALSVILAFMSLGSNAFLLLAILGVVIGVVNVKASESIKAILVIIGLPLVAGGLNVFPVLGQSLGGILANIAVFAGGAAIPVLLMAFHHTFSKK
jgi:hypothetical protein